MALQKQAVDISFAKGLDTKSDPFRVQAGNFLSLKNTIFNKNGQLTKRNGYDLLTQLPDNTTSYLTTFNNNLTAFGDTLQAYNASNQTWVEKATLDPVSLQTIPMIRSNTNQSQVDSVTAANGLTCVVYTDQDPSNLTTPIYMYAVLDSVTSQNIVAPIEIPVTTGTVTGSPRVFLLGSNFIIVFTNVIAATPHLQYIAVSTTNPEMVTANADIASNYTPDPSLSWDGIVANSSLYIAYNTTTGGQSVRITYLSTNLTVATPTTFAGQIATTMSLSADISNPSNPIIWAAYYDSASQDGFAFAVDKLLNQILAPTQIINNEDVLNITSVASQGFLYFLYEIDNNYTGDLSAFETHYINKNSLSQAGVLGTKSVLDRSVGLASKAFLIDAFPYVMGVYDSPYQPTYFLLNALNGKVVSKLAYSNGYGYYAVGLPSVTVINDEAQLAYIVKTAVQSVNKSQGVSNSQPVYAQTGLNLAKYDFSVKASSSEIGENLNIAGGFLGAYDGYSFVEQGFFLYPDPVAATWSATGGSMAAQPDGSTNTNAYFYQVTYEWSDNQGNLFRSAPSLPVSVTTTGALTTGSVTLTIPTLRLTYKTQNPVKIVIYRWSIGQQNYYQTTSILLPTLNDTTVDSITYTDVHSDSQILGNNLIYTTGGVIENVAAPGTDNITLFNNRLWLINAEDRNQLWYSKQVIESVPVEMSDLFTIYVPPVTASIGDTGPMTALAPMDDKLIIFKNQALGYINGNGPDNTGLNNQYSEFVLINSVVGCINQQSIVFTPLGLIFQSDKGLWLLGRDLSTSYIGAPVEALTDNATVLSAFNAPGTNEVRFTMDSGLTIMYDYYYNQWSSFTNIPAVSSTVYELLHTYVNDRGEVLQETPGEFLDNSSPVLMSFKSSWFNLAGVQGYERFYQMYMLGTYISPFKLNVSIAYDYNESLFQQTIVTPQSPTQAWGGEQLWGSGSPWGGPSKVFEARLFPSKQKCESFQISVDEFYDPSYNIMAGEGFTLSGLNLVVGMKKGYRTSSASRSFG